MGLDRMVRNKWNHVLLFDVYPEYFDVRLTMLYDYVGHVKMRLDLLFFLARQY